MLEFTPEMTIAFDGDKMAAGTAAAYAQFAKEETNFVQRAASFATQAIVAAGTWFGSRLQDPGGYALVGCTVVIEEHFCVILIQLLLTQQI